MGKEQVIKFCAENVQKFLLNGGKFVRNIKAPKITSDTVFTLNQNYAKAVTPGKHKIPRFIYHMTNRANYESMLRDGVIRASDDALLGKGVFTTELTNFFKHWRRSNSWGSSSLQERLIEQVAKGQDEIVMLKIPTGRLASDKLVIRSQNRLFSWSYSNNGRSALNEVEEFFMNNVSQNSDWINRFRTLLKSSITKRESKEVVEHLTSGSPAKMSGLYKQRKEALEYAYLDDILMSDVQKIGELNIKALRATAEYDPVRPMRSIFTNLLKGTPEVKGAELLSC